MSSPAPISDLQPAGSPLVDRDYSLEHKYTRPEGRIYLSGVQALVRLPLMQQMRDRAAGLNTAGFISGYRGSPLGGFDLELWKAKKHLAASSIEFTPGLNEDLGATMVWGTQQTNLFPGAKYDGVFSMWYGKGPGVDRCGDVFKHGNAAGTSQAWTACWRWRPTTTPAAPRPCRTAASCEFVSAMMPVLNPAGVQDILDMGLLGWAMSRFTGRWVGFKTIAETVESSASVNVNPHQLDIILPEDFDRAAGRAQHPLAGPAAGSGNAPAPVRGGGCAGLRARQPHRQDHLRSVRARAWASSPPARATSTCCRRSSTWASTTRLPRTSASACTRSA